MAVYLLDEQAPKADLAPAHPMESYHQNRWGMRRSFRSWTHQNSQLNINPIRNTKSIANQRKPRSHEDMLSSMSPEAVGFIIVLKYSCPLERSAYEPYTFRNT
jgi:hypothetical protein